MRKPKCKNPECRKPFDRIYNTTQQVCSVECASRVAALKREKAEKETKRVQRRELREAKEKAKPLRKWLNEAQSAVNAYIRYRDRNEPCISCGRYHQGQWHAGHYRPSGQWSLLRFNEINIYKQCQPCNSAKSGNLIEYRKNLIRKIGAESVDWLEGPHATKRWTVEELREIITVYKAKLAEAKKANGE